MMQSATTIRVYGSKNVSDCVSALSIYGEIARIDVTKAESLGYSTATFFDVRGAQCALEQLGDKLSAPASAAEQDFRALAAPFEIGPAHYQLFGEVANWCALPNGCLGVEFFDMRALQRALVAVEGSRPVPVSQIQASTSADTASMLAPPLGCDGLTAAQAKESYSSDGGSTQDTDDVKPPKPTTQTIFYSSAGKHGTRAINMKPVSPDEFESLDLNLDKIANGEDNRTTVMLRKISKAKTQTDLVLLLEQCGLAGRYTFLYLPYDKRRNTHCRYAFIDFLSPQDVWQLGTSFREFQKLSKAACGMGLDEDLPLVSYARLQGRQRLLKHFNDAAVMNDKIISHRPKFMSDQMVAQFSIHADQGSCKVPAH